jgi:hypothetical protein
VGGLVRRTEPITVARKKISTTVYVERDQDEALKSLRDRTGIPIAVLIRDAIDLGLARWTDETDRVLSKSEELIEEARHQAEQEHRHLGPLHVEIDILINHARQLRLERDQALRLVEHYRAALRTAQKSLSDAMEPTTDLRQAVGR